MIKKLMIIFCLCMFYFSCMGYSQEVIQNKKTHAFYSTMLENDIYPMIEKRIEKYRGTQITPKQGKEIESLIKQDMSSYLNKHKILTHIIIKIQPHQHGEARFLALQIITTFLDESESFDQVPIIITYVKHFIIFNKYISSLKAGI